MDHLRKIISLSNFLVICSIMVQAICAATDTINSSQTIRDGETMVSSGGVFELGFFSPGNSENRYVGLWYKNITVTTVVWVANRGSPVQNKSGALKLTEQGLLVILDDTNGSIVWSSNRSSSSLSCWRSGDDPAPGVVTGHMDPTGYPQLFIKRENVTQSRLGPWNGIQFSGARTQIETSVLKLIITRNDKEVMYRVAVLDHSVLLRTTISQSGVGQRWSWNYQTQDWNLYLNFPGDNCDTYGLCSSYGRCNIGNSASCKCLDDRFTPKESEAWLRGDWSGGCVRRTNLSCQGDVFLKYSGIKMPDARTSWINESMTLGECREECLRNCSCTAYTQLDIRGAGSGCLFYRGDLVDIRDTSPGGQEIYIRMASSELGKAGGRTRDCCEKIVKNFKPRA